MPEDTITTQEDENLSLENTEQPEAQEADGKVYTAEEVELLKRKMQSDSEKWVQKLIQEKKIYEQAMDETAKVADNQEYLVELHDKNPAVAKILLDKYYQWMDIETFKNRIWYEEDLSDPVIAQKRIELEAQKKYEALLVDKAKEEFIKKLDLSGEEKVKFEEAFEERKQLKSFNASNIEANLEKAYREIADINSLKNINNQELIAKTIGTWEWKGWTWWSAKKTWIQNEISDFLKTYMPN